MASLLCSPSARDWASLISSGGKLWAWRAVLCGKAEALRGLSSRQKAIGSSNGRITGLFLQSWALLKPCVSAHLCNSISMPISADPWKRQDSLAALDKWKNDLYLTLTIWVFHWNNFIRLSLTHTAAYQTSYWRKNNWRRLQAVRQTSTLVPTSLWTNLEAVRN